MCGHIMFVNASVSSQIFGQAGKPAMQAILWVGQVQAQDLCVVTLSLSMLASARGYLGRQTSLQCRPSCGSDRCRLRTCVWSHTPCQCLRQLADIWAGRQACNAGNLVGRTGADSGPVCGHIIIVNAGVSSQMSGQADR